MNQVFKNIKMLSADAYRATAKQMDCPPQT
jgi:hypothetical protein